MMIRYQSEVCFALYILCSRLLLRSILEHGETRGTGSQQYSDIHGAQ